MRSAFFIAAALATLPAGAACAEDIPAVILYWHDADTPVVNIPGIPYKLFSQHIRVRLEGVDAPEINDPNPVVRAWSAQGRDYATQTVPPGTEVTLKNVKWDNYGGRIDAIVPTGASDAATELLKRNYVKPYSGKGKRPKWTPADCHPPATAK